MKKLFGFLLAICVVAMLIVTPIGVSAADVDIDMGEGVVFTPGNIDGDDEDNINLKDLVMLAKKQAGWEVNPVIAALDTNGDGLFNLEDVNYFAQYLAGWDVVLNTEAFQA